MSTHSFLFVLPLLLTPICAQHFVRVRDKVVEKRGPAGGGQVSPLAYTPALCGTLVAAYDGQPILNGTCQRL
jgi:hypothetical protein